MGGGRQVRWEATICHTHTANVNARLVPIHGKRNPWHWRALSRVTVASTAFLLVVSARFSSRDFALSSASCSEGQRG
mgnify:CR=1 FL=1